MLSQNVAKATVPSHYMIRTNLPQRKPLNQWEGVYYFSGTSKRQRHVQLMQRRRLRESAILGFNKSCAAVTAQFEAAATATADSTGPTAATTAGDLHLAQALASHGLYGEATQVATGLHAARQLRPADYIGLVASLAGERVERRVLFAEAMCDPALTFKLMGDCGGEGRAAEAYRWYDRGMAALQEQSFTGGAAHSQSQPVTATATASQLTNALMRTLLTCGHRHVQSVPDAVYDRMGERGISPTMSTYEHVTLALALQGNNKEAESIFSFLQGHCADDMTIRSYNALLLGHREARAYDRCDQLWQELVDRRWPRASPLTAELYLRSIIDNSYTPMSGPLQRFGNVNAVEKKKAPMVLAQMEQLGLPRSHLSLPLTDEVEDALRKFSIHKSRFYEWGRAVKQFDFIEFRRRNGWLYDMHLTKNTTKNVPPVRDPTQPDATMASIATAEIPAFFSERHPWERQVLEEVLYTNETKERTDDVRAGDIYYDDTKGIHDRSSNWLNEVPETRYDQLYGVSHPNIAKMGVRRHLQVEYVNRQEVLDRDAALMRRTVSSGRRLRHRVDAARTHRNEGTLSGGGGKQQQQQQQEQ